MRRKTAAVILGVLLAAGTILAQTPSSGSTLTVAGIGVGTGVSDRELVGQAESFPAGVGQVTCLTRLDGAAGESAVTHVWSLGDKEMRRVELPLRSKSWRTWSQKNVKPGTWTVRVLDPAGVEIGKVSFTVGP